MTAPAGWLKNAVVSLNKPKYSVVDVLRKNLARYEQGRSRKTLHASELTKPDFCPRSEAFDDLAGIAQYDGMYIPLALKVTFEVGKVTEKLIAEDWGGAAIIGNWKCRVCNATRSMCSKPATDCTEWHRCSWEYMQWPAISQEYGVSGSVDTLWDVGAPLLLMVETKILNDKEFDTMIAPQPEHRIRTNLYLKLIADSHSPYKEKINLHEAAVLYTSRSYGKKSDQHKGEIIPFKEYSVKRDDEALKPFLDKARQLKVFRETGAMPAGICPTSSHKTAQKCKNCKACFSGDHPQQQENLVQCV